MILTAAFFPQTPHKRPIADFNSFEPPSALNDKSTLQMKQIFVRVTLSKDHADVYSRIVVYNQKDACTTQIGQTDNDDHFLKDKPGNASERYTRFTSSVDGKPVKLRSSVEQALGQGLPLRYVKTIHFKKHQTRVLEDWYRFTLTPDGRPGASEAEPGDNCQFRFIIDSRPTWQDALDKATLQIKFKHPIKGVPTQQFGDPSHGVIPIPPNRLVWHGFASPHIHGDTLVFRRKNFRPNTADDTDIFFRTP